MSEKTSVLFVCLGNICRSPMSEAIFRDIVQKRGLADQFEIDSAAMIDYHLGKQPHNRTLDCLQKHGISGFRHTVRQCSSADFASFDHIFGMDEDNMSLETKSSSKKALVELLGKYDPEGHLIVPDPYYQSGTKQFDEVFAQCLRCCDAFLDKIRPGSKQ